MELLVRWVGEKQSGWILFDVFLALLCILEVGRATGITGHTTWAAGAQKHSNEAILPLTTIPVGQGVPREGKVWS